MSDTHGAGQDVVRTRVQQVTLADPLVREFNPLPHGVAWEAKPRGSGFRFAGDAQPNRARLHLKPPRARAAPQVARPPGGGGVL